MIIHRGEDRMKTIGMIGGMSWESTASYYRAINQGIKSKLGGLHSAKIVLYSVDFEQIEGLLKTGDWDEIAEQLIRVAKKLESFGANFLMICTNTIHKIAPLIEENIEIPLLHIADAAGEAIKEKGYGTVGLIGTAPTMEMDFYKGRLLEKYGVETIIPEKKDRETINNVIFDELCLGKIEEASKNRYIEIIEDLAEKGAQAVILGCTEIAMLVSQKDTKIPLLDTTQIHADLAVSKAIRDC